MRGNVEPLEVPVSINRRRRRRDTRPSQSEDPVCTREANQRHLVMSRTMSTCVLKMERPNFPGWALSCNFESSGLSRDGTSWLSRSCTRSAEAGNALAVDIDHNHCSGSGTSTRSCKYQILTARMEAQMIQVATRFPGAVNPDD